jgi:hypothetical protein
MAPAQGVRSGRRHLAVFNWMAVALKEAYLE